MAGGKAIETPRGLIYTPNITPDKETSIGTWSDDDFYRSFREGISKEGENLYPVFPFYGRLAAVSKPENAN